MSAYLLFSQNKKIFRYINFRHTTNSVFLSVGNVLASVRTKMKNKKKKRKENIRWLFSWFTILFMARFMDLWWNKSQISEMRYWNIFLVFVSIHCVTWSIVTKKNWPDFNNGQTCSVVFKPKKTAVWQRQLLRRGEHGITRERKTSRRRGEKKSQLVY